MACRYGFSSVKRPVLVGVGNPVHQRGVTRTAGLVFSALPSLDKVKSAFLWGVGDDASYLADLVTRRL